MSLRSKMTVHQSTLLVMTLRFHQITSKSYLPETQKQNKQDVERNKKNTDRKCRQEVILGRGKKQMKKRNRQVAKWRPS